MNESTVSLSRLRTDLPYYAESVLKIRTKDRARGLVPLKFKPEQLRLLQMIDGMRAKGMPPRIVVLKARQVGISTAAQAIMFHEAHMTKLTTALVLAHKIESAETLFEMSKRFYDNMPKALRHHRRYSTKRTIHFDENDSKLQVEVQGEVRSYTANLVHLSELAFYKEPKTTMTAVLQTVPVTTDSLVIVESTPNGFGNEFHSLCVRAASEKYGFRLLFVPWFKEPEYQMLADFDERELDEEEIALQAEYGVTLNQLSWRRYKINTDFDGDVDQFMQEYPSDIKTCFLMSGRPVFKRESLRVYDAALPAESTVEKCEMEPAAKHENLAPNYRDSALVHSKMGRLRIYEHPRPRRRFVAGIDTSHGDPGSDGCSIAVLDQHNLNLVAMWSGRQPPELLAITCAMIGFYYNEMLATAEANGSGLLFLHELKSIYTNIYFRTTSPDSVAGKVTDKLGFWTSGKTREYAVNLGRKYVREQLGLLPDSGLISEMETMTFDEKDRPDHQAGKMDDRVIGFCLALCGHQRDPDAPLLPLPVEQAKAIRREMRRRRLDDNGGDYTDLLEIHGLTAEEMERVDERLDKRERRRERRGLNNQT